MFAEKLCSLNQNSKVIAFCPQNSLSSTNICCFKDVFSWGRKRCKKRKEDFERSISEWYLKGECHNCGIWHWQAGAWRCKGEYFVNLHNREGYVRGVDVSAILWSHIKSSDCKPLFDCKWGTPIQNATKCNMDQVVVRHNFELWCRKI